MNSNFIFQLSGIFTGLGLGLMLTPHVPIGFISMGIGVILVFVAIKMNNLEHNK